MISIVIPVYNAAAYIDDTLSKLITFAQDNLEEFEVILVNDGSTDNTFEKLSIWQSRYSQFRVIDNKTNQGKGGAVKDGVLAAIGEHVLFTDADLPYELNSIARLPTIFSSGADVVLGARTRERESRISNDGLRRKMLSKVFAGLANLALYKPVSDTQCGFKAFAREAAIDIFRDIKIKRFCFDVELISLAQAKGYAIAVLPVLLVNQEKTSVRIGLDGIRMLVDLAKLIAKRYLRRPAAAGRSLRA
ncbi:MAG TPA: glycosyltransferase [Candidatus Paceibacterota bacterium]|nr:glycosyltransferase [Candidatus Paceibacterota bacterium]